MRQASSGRLIATMFAAIRLTASMHDHFSGYNPQHGERECARRRRQMEKAALKKAGVL